MLLVRGGLNGKCVVNVEIFCLTPQPCATAVVTLGEAWIMVRLAVRVGEVSAARNEAGAVDSSSVIPITAGTTWGAPATAFTVASTGVRSTAGLAARTAAKSLGALMVGCRVPAPSGAKDSAGAYCSGQSLTMTGPATTLTGPDIAGTANSF